MIITCCRESSDRPLQLKSGNSTTTTFGKKLYIFSPRNAFISRIYFFQEIFLSCSTTYIPYIDKDHACSHPFLCHWHNRIFFWNGKATQVPCLIAFLLFSINNLKYSAFLYIFVSVWIMAGVCSLGFLGVTYPLYLCSHSLWKWWWSGGPCGW